MELIELEEFLRLNDKAQQLGADEQYDAGYELYDTLVKAMVCQMKLERFTSLRDIKELQNSVQCLECNVQRVTEKAKQYRERFENRALGKWHKTEDENPKNGEEVYMLFTYTDGDGKTHYKQRVGFITENDWYICCDTSGAAKWKPCDTPDYWTRAFEFSTEEQEEQEA